MNLISQDGDSSSGRELWLFPTPGKTVLGTLPTYPGRGCLEINGRAFAVSGSVLYEILDDWTYIVRGAMATDDLPATLSSSGATGNELFVTSGGEGYILDLLTNVFTNVVGDVNQGGYIGGYFVALDFATGTLKWSDLLDGLTWNGLSVQQRNDAGDAWISMWVGYTEIVLFGSETSVVWGQTGDADQPFAPLSGATMNYGVYVSFGVATAAGSPCWISRSNQGAGIVMRLNGYQPERISTDGVEWAIEQYIKAGEADDAVAWSYEQEGRPFLILSFPTANYTWVCDLKTGWWHERGEWSAPMMDYDAQRQVFHMFVFNTHVVLDNQGGNFYEQSLDVFDDAGTPLRRMRQTPCMVSKNMVEMIYFHRLEVRVQAGEGTVTTPDPQLVYQYSDDYGSTWSDERQESIGAMGEYSTIVAFDANGAGRYRVDRIVFSEPVPLYITGASVDFTVGTR